MTLLNLKFVVTLVHRMNSNEFESLKKFRVLSCLLFESRRSFHCSVPWNLRVEIIWTCKMTLCLNQHFVFDVMTMISLIFQCSEIRSEFSNSDTFRNDMQNKRYRSQRFTEKNSFRYYNIEKYIHYIYCRRHDNKMLVFDASFDTE